MTDTVQQQIDFLESQVKEIFKLNNISCLETKLKEILQLIDTLKRTYCMNELPNALTSDENIKILIEENVVVSQNHESALVDIENFELKNLHHISVE